MKSGSAIQSSNPAEHASAITPPEFRVRAAARIGLLAVVLAAAIPAWSSPPVAVDRDFNLQPGQALFLDLLAFASDADGDPLTCELGSAPQGVVNRPETCVYLYTDTEPVTFFYTVSDGSATDTAQVSIGTGGSTLHPTSGAAGLYAYISGPDQVTLSWQDVAEWEESFLVRGGPAPGDADLQTPATLLDTLAAGAVTWSHVFSPPRPVDSSFYFKVYACDSNGCVASNLAAVTFSAATANQPPVASPDGPFIVTSGRHLVIPFEVLLENDSDPDEGDSIFVVPPAIPDPPGFIATSQGQLRVVNGAFLYTHNLSGPGGTDTFSYTITDGSLNAAAPVTLNIAPPSPVAANLDTFATGKNQPLYIRFDDLTANDGGNPIRVTPFNFSRADHGLLDFCCGASATPEGFWFVPELDFVGIAEFQYSIWNSVSYSSAPVRITVSSQGPLTTLAKIDLLQHPFLEYPPGSGTARSVWLFSDFKRAFAPFNPPIPYPDEGQRLRFKLTFTGNAAPNATLITPGLASGSLWAPAGYEGAVVYTSCAGPGCGIAPDSNRQLRYTIRGNDNVSSSADAYLRHAAPPVVPPTEPQPFTAVSDLTATVSGRRLQINYGEMMDNDLLPPHGELDLEYLSQPIYGRIVNIAGFGGLVYQAPVNYVGVDSFVYTIQDRDYPDRRSSARVVIAVEDGRPVADAETVTVEAGQSIRVNVLEGDIDPQDGVQGLRVAAIVVAPAHGSAALDTDGKTIVYAPLATYSGADSLSYRVEDREGNFADAVVSITVVQPNQPPTAVDDQATFNLTAGWSSITIPVLENDSDADSDLLTVISASAPQWGSVKIQEDGSIYYEPAKNVPSLVAGDEFLYAISDGHGGMSSARVRIQFICDMCGGL